jgi:hypothetical protein
VQEKGLTTAEMVLVLFLKPVLQPLLDEQIWPGIVSATWPQTAGVRQGTDIAASLLIGLCLRR